MLETLFSKEKKSIKSLTFKVRRWPWTVNRTALAFTFYSLKALTPSKWFDSNQRGLKLKEVYCDPPVQGGHLKDTIKSSPFYQELDKQPAQWTDPWVPLVNPNNLKEANTRRIFQFFGILYWLSPSEQCGSKSNYWNKSAKRHGNRFYFLICFFFRT